MLLQRDKRTIKKTGYEKPQVTLAFLECLLQVDTNPIQSLSLRLMDTQRPSKDQWYL